jgi:hypothetical protein
MADALSAKPSAEATGFRSCAPQVSAPAVLNIWTRFIVALHARRSATRTALNSTPRFVRGIPYPFTFDSVRCHA